MQREYVLPAYKQRRIARRQPCRPAWAVPINCAVGAMRKATAIKLLGGTVTSAAAEVGVTPSAITQWPDELPSRLSDRVLAALARKHLPAEIIGAEEVRDAA